MIGGLEIAASYGPKSAWVLAKPAQKHGSAAADRLVMTSAEQCRDLGSATPLPSPHGLASARKNELAAARCCPVRRAK